MSLSRRHFLARGSSFALGFASLGAISARRAGARGLTIDDDAGFGPLVRDPKGMVDLPEGFWYSVISRTGEEMDDGYLVPGRHDGMAAFPGPDGLTVLVRNHEMESDWVALSPFGPDAKRLKQIHADRLFDRGYDKTPGLGGTTTLVFDTRTHTLRRHFLSLAGTERNCAGGPTPWGTWLSCEETDNGRNARHEQSHGWVFEVPADPASGLIQAEPLRAMGRFYHEAAAVNPATDVVYMTEDLDDGLIYRFVPNTRQNLRAGGRLQALMLRDRSGAVTNNWGETRQITPREPLACQWVDLEDVHSPKFNLRKQGHEGKGAATFARGEGMWWAAENADDAPPDRGSIFFTCTSGGKAREGQLWRYRPSPVEGTPDEDKTPGTLELFLEPNNASELNNPDNLTVAPWGDLIICEDDTGDAPDQQRLVGITSSGKPYPLARNRLSDSEWAGATFSPDGSTLFANIQTPGLTLAITGPWKKRRG